MKKLITLVLLLGVVVTSNVEVHGERGPSIHDIVWADLVTPEIGGARREVPVTEGEYDQDNKAVALNFVENVGAVAIVIKTVDNKVCYSTTANTASEVSKSIYPSLAPGMYVIEISGNKYHSVGDFYVEEDLDEDNM